MLAEADCVVCHQRRSLDELLRVTNRRTGWWRLVCRPTLHTPCFRRHVGRADVDRIEPAATAISSAASVKT